MPANRFSPVQITGKAAKPTAVPDKIATLLCGKNLINNNGFLFQ
jgi:hypothetical protein